MIQNFNLQKPAQEAFSASGSVCYPYAQSIRFYPSYAKSATLLATSVETAIVGYQTEIAENEQHCRNLAQQHHQVTFVFYTNVFKVKSFCFLNGSSCGNFLKFFLLLGLKNFKKLTASRT